jgi:hypothetical protein
MEVLLAGEAEKLTRKPVELALAGDTSALRLCLESLFPPRKERTIQFALPPIQSVAQISEAMMALASAVSTGQITPSEGEAVAGILALQVNVVATAELRTASGDFGKFGRKPPPQGRSGATGSPVRMVLFFSCFSREALEDCGYDTVIAMLTMGNLKARIKRLEQRLEREERQGHTLEQPLREIWEADPKGFELEAMKPGSDSLLMQQIMEEEANTESSGAGVKRGYHRRAPLPRETVSAPNTATLGGKRGRAVLAVLIGCGLRRSEVCALTIEHIQQRKGRCVICDLVGKRGHIRTAQMPAWVKAAIDGWTAAAGIQSGAVFRRVNRGGHVWGEKIGNPHSLWLAGVYCEPPKQASGSMFYQPLSVICRCITHD